MKIKEVRCVWKRDSLEDMAWCCRCFLTELAIETTPVLIRVGPIVFCYEPAPTEESNDDAKIIDMLCYVEVDPKTCPRYVKINVENMEPIIVPIINQTNHPIPRQILKAAKILKEE